MPGGNADELHQGNDAVGGIVEAPNSDGAVGLGGWSKRHEGSGHCGESYFYQIRLNLIEFRYISTIFS